MRVKTEEKNAKQKKKQVKTGEKKVQENQVRGWGVSMLHRGTPSTINKGLV